MGGKNLPPNRAQLEQLSTEELKEIIRADAESTSGNDEDFIFTVLEVIEEREKQQPDYRPPDLDAAWERFQRYYNTPDGVGHSLFPAEEAQEEISVLPEKDLPMGRPARKWIVAVAAVIAALFAGAFTAQAAGIDIGGIFARWTDDIFHFEGSAVSANHTPEWAVAMIKQCADFGLIPIDVPDNYEAGMLTSTDTGAWQEVHQIFSSADGTSFSVRIRLYSSTEFIYHYWVEKSNQDVEEYESCRGIVYLFSNLNEHNAVMQEGLAEVSITGNVSGDEMKSLFDSIK